MKAKLPALLVFLTFSGLVSTLEPASCELQLEESLLLEIAVYSDGSTSWTVTRRYALKTEDDVEVFQAFLLEFEVKKTDYLNLFSNNTRIMVDRASNYTGRDMNATDFGVEAEILQAPTGSLGRIAYKFIWTGFAATSEQQIRVGDVFDVGFLLFENDELTIRYPDEYWVVEAVPDPDLRVDEEQALTWRGLTSFGAEEPRVVLETDTTSMIGIIQTYGPFVALVAAGVVLGAFTYHKLESRKQERMEKRGPQIPTEIESDEQKVVRLLETMGGKAFQSTLTEKCGFSKSKMSQLLTHMEDIGVVKREKRGREKIVTLRRKQSE